MALAGSLLKRPLQPSLVAPLLTSLPRPPCGPRSATLCSATDRSAQWVEIYQDFMLTTMCHCNAHHSVSGAPKTNKEHAPKNGKTKGSNKGGSTSSDEDIRKLRLEKVQYA